RVAGPMTRRVQDSAMLLSVLSRPDNRDFMNMPYLDTDYAGQLEGLSLKGLRIGFIREMGAGLKPHAAVLDAVDDAAKALSAAGAEVIPTPSFLTPEMLEGMVRFFEARSYNDVMALREDVRAKILPFVHEWCTYRAGSFTGPEVMAAYTQIIAMREAAV